MLLWHQAIYSYYLYYMTVHFPTFQHLFHHLLLILPLMNEKAQLLLDFFDRLRAGPMAPPYMRPARWRARRPPRAPSRPYGRKGIGPNASLGMHPYGHIRWRKDITGR